MQNEHQLIHSKEGLYFGFVVTASILIYLSFLVTIIGIFIMAAIIFSMWLLHSYTMVSIRKNGIKIGPQQFPEFYEQASAIAKRMNMNSMPDIYIVQSGGILNAFATKFGLKNMVVIYSDVFALIDQQATTEVQYILAHEFTHVKRRHVGLAWFLLPGLSVPFLASAYSRACEFTCDRYAAFYTQSPEAAKNALTILAVGPQVYTQVNQHEFVKQINEENGIFSWIDEITSSHPNLPRRIHAIDLFFNPEAAIPLKNSRKGIIAAIISLLLFVGIVAFSLGAITKSIGEYISSGEAFDGLADDFYYDIDSFSPLMEAVLDEDLELIDTLSDNSVMLNQTNSDGYTALHIAVIEEQHQIIEALLEAGAKTDTIDTYDFTPLAEAAMYNDIKTARLLLEHGADPAFHQNVALNSIEDNDEMLELLKSYLD